jgi:Putative DNA-binding domain
VPFSATLDAFAAALNAPTSPPPLQTHGREGVPDAKRFSVYRNNVAVSLIGAVEARFPVTRRLVGDEFFRAMARSFTARHKPANAVIIHYGAGFADFIAAFEPARELAYLPDVARLENAWVEAYHAAEAEPLSLGAIAEIDPARFAELKFAFHPAARLLRSDHPVGSIWAGHQGGGEVTPPKNWSGEETLVTRPQADVLVRILPPSGYEFASALRSGATLAEAHVAAGRADFDAGAHLVGLIEAGAITQILK